ncbi:RxLR effector protein [Phytophthora megakarya]|uniref:RxLR effector protein n=1 Tax=Phytophthora megakarya TaxID=4795 RepID=A0A225VJD9_9STRA|nr:RxLR effector protein [Phytophthora megakarya]
MRFLFITVVVLAIFEIPSAALSTNTQAHPLPIQATAPDAMSYGEHPVLDKGSRNKLLRPSIAHSHMKTRKDEEVSHEQVDEERGISILSKKMYEKLKRFSEKYYHPTDFLYDVLNLLSAIVHYMT